jgi:hypothetical protein
LQRRVRYKAAVPIMFALDFGSGQTRRQRAARHDMFHANIMRGVVEIDEVASAHIHRADAKTGHPAIDEVKIHQAFECRFQRGDIVIAQRIDIPGYERQGRWDPRLEEARRAPKQSVESAPLIDPCVGELVLDFHRRHISDADGGGADGLPEFPQPRDALFRRVASDQRRIDGANRNTGDPIGMQTGLRQGLIDARLIGAESAATLEDESNAFKRRALLTRCVLRMGACDLPSSVMDEPPKVQFRAMAVTPRHA